MTNESGNTGFAEQKLGYGVASAEYEAAGWLPIPLDGKVVKVKGATGRSGSVTPEKIKDWSTQFPEANTGVVANGWIAIDVDEHDEKHGAEEFLKLQRKHGKLPKTYKSSARGAESPAGQYFFRVDDVVPYESNPAPDIEIIHPAHRYSAVFPSEHPVLKTVYTWYDQDGNPLTGIPDVDSLPELPLGWVLAFSKPEALSLDYAQAYKGNLNEWIDWLDNSEPTHFTLELIETVETLQHIGHDGLLKLLIQVRDLQTNLWERGTRKAFDAIASKYFNTTREQDPTTEFNNLLRWVIGDKWVPQPQSSQTAREIVLKMLEQVEKLDESNFWNSRDSLKKIYSLGRKKVIAPYSLLGMVLMRTLHGIPWNVYYRSFRGTHALNSLGAFVGPTGTGKSLTLEVISDYVAFADSPISMGGDGSWTSIIEPGSGEAIPEHYMAWYEDESGKKRKDWKNANHSALFAFDEIGMLESRQAREGATIIEFAKQGWSGGVLGRELASGRGTMLLPKTYRFGMFANVQPARAGILFTPSAISGGLPSRFLFFSTQDSSARKEYDETPATVIKLPQVNWVGVDYIDALPSMNEAHRAESFKSVDGGLDELDSHLLLTRAKVAVALAVMDGRSELNEEDWELSKYVINHSKETRAQVLQVLKGAFGKEIARQGEAAGMKSAIAAEVADNRMILHVAKRIKQLRAEGVPELGQKGLRKRLRNNQRPYFKDAMKFLETNTDV